LYAVSDARGNQLAKTDAEFLNAHPRQARGKKMPCFVDEYEDRDEDDDEEEDEHVQSAKYRARREADPPRY